MERTSWNWFDLFPFLKQYPNHVVGGFFVGVLLVVLFVFARISVRKLLRNEEKALVPSGKMTFQNFFEIVSEFLWNLCESVMGEKLAREFYGLIGTLFVYILTCNLLGLIPGFLPPTKDFNTTLALGVFVFVYYNYIGIKTHGIGYIKQFLGPLLWLSPLMFVIELASHMFRPFSLALRLRGNMLGDHVVMSVFSHLVPYLLPVVFYGLGLFVAVVQAFVFSLLTMVYLSLATAHDH